jgi:hydrogenase maturation protein HypF
LRVEIEGAVQGVGFRPHVYRLAHELGLSGWVVNGNQGVVVEVEGPRRILDRFYSNLHRELPAAAEIEDARRTWLAPEGCDGFRIEPSESRGELSARVLPDIATCERCLSEIADPTDRRYRYPFTNCTRCGPRFSIVEGLPYDRARTTMESFVMCDACRTEYEDPADRRFHAQPDACPVCGPRIAWWAGARTAEVRDEAALEAAVLALRDGSIVAVKGLGGFHLMVDAGNAAAVDRLRRSKPRRSRPFAVMARDRRQAAELCRIDEASAELLESASAPIVLLPRLDTAPVADDVAPDNPYLGLMLPYTPLHHLLLDATGFPVVATSGNLSDEPICTDEEEARERLHGIADGFLVHDRPIARHVDDSVAWIVRGRPRLIRRARGYAPAPVRLHREVPPILAVGAHFKNSVALGIGRQVFVSQHIGDMATPQALDAFERVIDDFLELYEVAPAAVAHDAHPDYASTHWARAHLPGTRRFAVQHHHAHLASVLAETGVREPTLGVTWDGTGYGDDGSIWGGEFLLGDCRDYRRVAHLRRFRLPGGEAAVREPCRVALAILDELQDEGLTPPADLPPVASFDPNDLPLLFDMIRRGVQAPLTTSAGRLFDAAAAIAGLRQFTDFEGQAAMELEYAAGRETAAPYPLPLRDGDPLVLDWGPLFAALVADVVRGVPSTTMAARFHQALVAGIVAVATAVGCPRVALTGGCFQNRRLVEDTSTALEAAGFEPLLNERVPPNDGGIGLGQVAVAAARLESEE